MKTPGAILFIFFSLFFFACKNNDQASQESNVHKERKAKVKADNFAVNNLVSHYIALKNNLVNDDAATAATAAGMFSEELMNMNTSELNNEQKSTYERVKNELKVNADQIAATNTDISKQRENFDLLSRDFITLLKSTQSGKKLFVTFCPMFNNNKGASWISDKKEIKNPYYGKQMLTCGEVKEVIQSR